MKKRIFKMTDEEKEKFVKMSGSILLWVGEARSISYMSEKLNLHPNEVETNMEEILYVLKKQVGIKRFLKILFMK